MAQYDLYHIEERLKEHDERLSIDFDFNRQVHRILWFNDRSWRNEVVMTVPLGQLDDRVYRRIVQIDRANGYDPFGVISHWLEQREREEERKIHDMAMDLADTISASFRMKPSRSID